MRAPLLLLLFGLRLLAGAQSNATEGVAALSFSRSIPVAMNAVQLFDAATYAWNWTFGKEPGARTLATDRSQGSITGSARLNFRSAMLTGREETMGTVSYRVQISADAGQCRIVVSDLVHTGNRTTPRGGIHLKQLMRADKDALRVGGMSRTNVERLHGELRSAAEERIQELLQLFEAKLRSQVDP